MARGINCHAEFVTLVSWAMSIGQGEKPPRLRVGERRLLEAARAWMPLLDSLENVMCWVKDAEGRFVEANSALAALVGREKQELAGLTDLDLFAPEFAAEYQRDDAEVMAGGRVVFNKPELIDLARGGAEWRMTSKLALLDEAGRAVGTVGVSRRMAGAAAPEVEDNLLRLVREARESPSRGLTVATLAARAGVSVPTLERHIRKRFGATPRTFLAEIRLNEAARLLKETNLSVSEVADRTGYESAASFTRAFRRRHGVAPGEYRRKFRRG